MKIIVWIIALVTGLYLIVLVLLLVFQSRLVYFPSADIGATPGFSGMDYEDVYFRTADDQTLHGWFVPAGENALTLLFCHGNAGNISGRIANIEQFHSLGLNVFIFDYQGYGLSSGRPSEQGTYTDAQGAWHYLIGDRGISADQLIVFGRSLGGPIAARLAVHNQPRALIIESSFTSLPELGAEVYPYFPVRFLSLIKYPTLEYVKGVQSPVLIGHSLKDNLIPFHHGRRLYEAANEPKYWMEMMGDHNVGFIETGDQYLDEIAGFLRTLKKPG
ncbi:MAG: alpha/beta hydrolase [Balneolales bacterium]